MDPPLQSPLSQQKRPDNFKPKILEIYEQLFDAAVEPSEGLWRELFLLKPEQRKLQSLLVALGPNDLLHDQLQYRTRQLFRRAIERVNNGTPPFDEYALDTLTVFLEGVLGKRYANPSSDIIEVIAGLDAIDTVFAEFTAALDKTIMDGRTLDVRQKAVRAGLAAIAGSYQTGLVTYFFNRDLFASLMKLVHDADDHFRAFGPIALLGLLVNYNKFEFQNPYQMRLQDFVNHEVMDDITVALGQIFEECRDEYIAIHNDQASTWSFGGALSALTLGLASTPGTANDDLDEKAKTELAEQPIPEISIALPFYDLVNANKQFCSTFVRSRPESKQEASPMGSFVSLSSYVLQNAHRSPRASLYISHMLQILCILVEDPVIAKELSGADAATSIRLARQRPPFLPPVQGERPPLQAILDLSIDGINHNLRRRLDVNLYILLLALELRLLTFLIRSRTRLTFHWAEMWRSLLSFVRFLNTYADHLKTITGIEELVSLLVRVLGLALAHGEAFLPDAKSYDDLFYKVFESGEALAKFRDSFGLRKGRDAAAMKTLTGVSSHFNTLLDEERTKGNKHLSPREITKLIKQGYDTLAIPATEGLDSWEVYREADRKNMVKRVVRATVVDIRQLLAKRPF